LDHQPWRQYGKCASLNPNEVDDLFFIGRGKSPKPAQAFCEGCPVRKQCLYYAVYYNLDGIWAGTTDDERRNLRPFIINDVIEAMSLTVYEVHDIRVFLPDTESVHQRSESSGWDDERLVG
jgi:hypothetical protein